MFEGSRVVVVVPARDEAAHVAGVVATMPAFVDSIVLVDDGSTDGTATVARRTADPRLTVLRREESRGVGAAIVAGYRHALAQGGGPYDVFAVMAGDGQMDPSDLPRLVAPVARGEADYAKGNRLAWPGVKALMPRARRLGVQAFSRATSWAVGVAIRDSQCGYTALSRRACEGLDLDGLWPGFGYPNDLLGQLVARGARVVETPVRPIYAGEVSHLRLWHVPTIAALVVRARLRVRRRVSPPRAE